MNEDSPSGTDDSEANSESVLNEDTSSTFGLNKEVLELIALFGSLCIGALLGLGFLIRGELMLAGIFFLIGSGIPVLLAVNGNSKNKRHNKPSSSTKECPDCGWHNHQANNNCVDCGETFPDRADHQQTNHSKYICQNCGWQNPRSNNYCMDCGDVLNE
ncbi:hypothetical protein PNP59_13845 [Halobacterium salinarum]|uniref:hypothetical protein n=1 Tax=Halobacterium salinarum TaxID=2242 RepID=UPI0025543D09|nr:hypothetical protein [Halobacterium salinarum]MDL0131990.1 hypothetical protein [Halobacterium salinarum]